MEVAKIVHMDHGQTVLRRENTESRAGLSGCRRGCQPGSLKRRRSLLLAVVGSVVPDFIGKVATEDAPHFL
jgi:hypothetical protein